MVILWSQVGFGLENSPIEADRLIRQKVPMGVLIELEAGRFQDLIVEFKHQDIRGEAAFKRQARQLRFNDKQIHRV